jgi:hypothetical protein
MLGFFTRELSDYEIIKKILGEKKFSLGFKDTYILSAYDLLECNLEPYWGQRAIDEIHINTIANGIRNSGGLFHPIILANVIPREEYSILDGQHRYSALSRISETQRKKIFIQVDVINFESEDDQWIMTNYEWINIIKGMPRDQLEKETKATCIVDECVKYFGKFGGGYFKIGDFSEKNKQNSRLIKAKFKQEILERIEKISSVEEGFQKVIEYNKKCNLHYNQKFKGVRIGKNTFDECIKREFWLGINFPAWLDEVF